MRTQSEAGRLKMPLWLKKTLLCSWKKLIYETVFADSVISENNDNTFKIRLDRFWANQELIFDCKWHVNRNRQQQFC